MSEPRIVLGDPAAAAPERTFSAADMDNVLAAYQFERGRRQALEAERAEVLTALKGALVHAAQLYDDRLQCGECGYRPDREHADGCQVAQAVALVARIEGA